MNITPPTISPIIKKSILDIYQAFSDLCKKHSLRHWVAYGTMLGAVRHQGFIPWDDDFDVFMLRDDYERFLAIADLELPPYYRPVTCRNCRVYPNTFGKIQESRKEFYDNLKKQTDYFNPHGLYIDIFPLDGCPNSLFAKLNDFIHSSACFCRHSHLFRHGKHGSVLGKLIDCFGTLLYPFFMSEKTENDFAQCAEKWYASFPLSSPFIRQGSFIARFQKKELVFPKESFAESIILPFEHIDVPVPKDYDNVLRILYGADYMTPPPPEKRVSEHSKLDIAPWLYGPNIE